MLRPSNLSRNHSTCSALIKLGMSSARCHLWPPACGPFLEPAWGPFFPPAFFAPLLPPALPAPLLAAAFFAAFVTMKSSVNCRHYHRYRLGRSLLLCSDLLFAFQNLETRDLKPADVYN